MRSPALQPATVSCLLLLPILWIVGNVPQTLAACTLASRGQYDCSSCTSGNPQMVGDDVLHQNLAPLGLASANITRNFSPSCTHVFAACRRDGAGSQMQAKLSTYAYAMLTGMVYVHVPITRLDHFGEQEQATIVPKLEEFFNLGSGEMTLSTALQQSNKVQPCAVLACFSFFDDYPHGTDCWDLVKHNLYRKYMSTPKPRTYFRGQNSAVKVALHIRRGDVDLFKATDGDRYSSNEYYIDVLLRIQQSLPPTLRNGMDIVLFSEGNPADFNSIVRAFPSTRLFLGADLLRSLHTLITADIMVMARSSMSYLAAIYNQGVVIYDPYWHKKHPAWLLHNKTDGTVLSSGLNTSAVHQLLINRLMERQAVRPLGGLGRFHLRNSTHTAA